jgi:hypothetical protein
MTEELVATVSVRVRDDGVEAVVTLDNLRATLFIGSEEFQADNAVKLAAFIESLPGALHSGLSHMSNHLGEAIRDE